MQKKQNGLIWFHNNLRVNDNQSLTSAISENKTVIAVYIFDSSHYEISNYGFKKTEKFRAKFNIETVVELKQNLKKINIELLVYKDLPVKIISNIVNKYNISTIYFQEEWTTEEVNISRSLRKIIDSSVSFNTNYNQFLFHPEDIQFEKDSIPDIFSNFRIKYEKSTIVREEYIAKAMPENNLIENITQIPTLNDLGFQNFEIDFRTAFPFKGGENQALIRLNNYFWESKNLSNYKETRNQLIGTEFSSKFSPWLANGSISAKTIYWQIHKYEIEINKNDSTYWLIFELLWRDYFKYISLKHGSKIFQIRGIKNIQYDYRFNTDAVNQWIDGKTKENFINANMIELKKTGFMSNRGRQNVASYFAKDLLLDWRIGAAYFESMLIDYDVHSNYGNWMYLSGVGNDSRNRKFNIKLQVTNYDSQNIYQDLWLK